MHTGVVCAGTFIVLVPCPRAAHGVCRPGKLDAAAILVAGVEEVQCPIMALRAPRQTSRMQLLSAGAPATLCMLKCTEGPLNCSIRATEAHEHLHGTVVAAAAPLRLGWPPSWLCYDLLWGGPGQATIR